ncbi:MAG: hypothetical protein WC376_03225 [Candidatus Nanoarchaeia archaeon]|jgi:hypothetical protein
MFNLPSAAKLYIDSENLTQNIGLLLNYKKTKAQAQAQPNFDEKRFNEQFSAAYTIPIEYLNKIEEISKESFKACSQELGRYELVNLNSSLGNYSCAQDKFKKTINYFDSNLESVLSADNANYTNTIAKINELKTNAKGALTDYIKRFKKDYDNLTVDDFKGANVSEEMAMQRYAIHLVTTFLKSNQSKEENKQAVTKVVKGLKSTQKKIANYENKKLKINDKTSKGLYASNHSIAQVDDILGEGYINKKRWNDNLAAPFSDEIGVLINETSQQFVTNE